MTSNTKEKALELAIENHLNKRCGYATGDRHHFNAHYAIDTNKFWDFLVKTHKKELDTLKHHNPNDWQRKILERFDRVVKKQGILYLLKKGLQVDDADFNLRYPTPLASSGETVKQNFAANIFSCTRQIPYSVSNPRETIDMVLFINGIPIITLELKNPWTGQTAQYHGQRQYRQARDHTQPLLQFGRCLVHMTVDTDEIYMTTKLEGKDTLFLPFNKGDHFGKGNPPNPNGHKTAYLWETVFTKESLANIIQHFVRLDGGKGALNTRTLFFPRYHQLDVVRKLIQDIEINGVGQTYLIQHSAGSGKSNSITWAAYQLIETYPANQLIADAKRLDQPLFDSVIVVTDRRLLDKQLRENIKDFSEVKNIIAAAYTASDLKRALECGKKIIITTIQKFPFIIDGISNLSSKRFAVIIDEAHSSQSGAAHDNMNRAMGKDDIEDAQDEILAAMRSRKMRGNASYLAFTATPKNTTLEKFGQKQKDGSYKPFHLYPMKQAIEEGFILDVLANYTTYKSYYEIQKSIAENPEFNTKKAQKKLRAYVERGQQTINTKAEIILEHFIPHIVYAKKLKGKAKGMVVTQNIETTIRYYKAISALLEQYNNPFKVAVAFSESKQVDGIEYTEVGINGFPESETKDKFDSDQYRLLIVTKKYLTGFDQPKLCAMYVDKKLAGVSCVQSLSRLNRSAPKLGKKTEDLFILDFFNSVKDIKQSFDPFYTATTLSQATDINVLHELKNEMDDVGVYEWYEVEDFVKRYFSTQDAQTLSPIMDIAAERFNHNLALQANEKINFKVKAKQFVKTYGQMASIMPYEISVWEKLFWFLKFLVPKLKIQDPEADALDELLESVDLTSYGLERVKLNHKISLDAAETEVDPQNPNPRGAYTEEKQLNKLDEIIRSFNERWFKDWSATPEEQRVKFVNIAESVQSHPDFESKYHNNPDLHHRKLAFDKIIKAVMLKRRKDELELYKLFAENPEFRALWQQNLELTISLEKSSTNNKLLTQ